MRAAAIVAGAMMLLTGCGDLVGTAVPENARYRGSLIDRFGNPLDGAAASMGEQDAARRIDLCALINGAATRELGTVTYAGPDQSLGDCQVLIGDRTGPVTKVNVSMSIQPVLGGTKTMYGSRVGNGPHDSGSSCSIAVIYNEERAMSFTADGDNTASACPALHAIVTEAVPLLDDPPSRAVPLGDPCSFLDTLYPPEQPLFLSGLNPSTCDYSLGVREPDDSNRYIVGTSTAIRVLIDQPPPDARMLQLAGVPAYEQPGANTYCTITAFAGVAQPFVRPGWDGEPTDYVEVLDIAGRDCAVVREIAVAAVKTYLGR
ncbi:hypothetical protein [Nocardia sp. SSK8]|uniref:hypothetical protein n=1 Tax=Nocardia sp. SSK8 TaxID=3120154 RepID=UPI0030086B7D